MHTSKPTVRLLRAFLLLFAWSALVGLVVAALRAYVGLPGGDSDSWSNAVGAGIGVVLIMLGVLAFNVLISRGSLRRFARHD